MASKSRLGKGLGALFPALPGSSPTSPSRTSPPIQRRRRTSIPWRPKSPPSPIHFVSSSRRLRAQVVNRPHRNIVPGENPPRSGRRSRRWIRWRIPVICSSAPPYLRRRDVVHPLMPRTHTPVFHVKPRALRPMMVFHVKPAKQSDSPFHVKQGMKRTTKGRPCAR